MLPTRLKLLIPGSDHQDFTTDFLQGKSNLQGVASPFLVVWLKTSIQFQLNYFEILLVRDLPAFLPLLWPFQKNVWKNGKWHMAQHQM